MRKASFTALLLAAGALPLGACTSLFGIHFAHNKPKVRPIDGETPMQAATAASASSTEAGRQHLADGRIGLAVESFQKALGAGEPIAPAANGLGVAYARLGRFELALRYFQEAVAAAPSDPRYSENIGRLTRSPAMAMRHDADLASAALEAPVKHQDATAAAEPGRLQRVSRGEVRIVTVPAQSAPVRSAGMQGEKRFKPIVRLTIPEAAPVQPRSFVRITLPEPKPALNAGEKTARR